MYETATLSPIHEPKAISASTTCPNEMLRVDIAAVTARGWESVEGTWLVQQVTDRCPGWAAKIDQWCNRYPGTLPPEDVLTACWLTINRFPERLIEAKAPWAYLWTSVRNELAVEITSESLLSARHARRAGTERPERLVRIGLESHHLDSALDADPVPPPTQRSEGLITLVRILADGCGELVEYWGDVVDRALDVMADSRRSYEETNLRRDPYLLHEAHLTPEELSALAALLIGPRRGDRAAQSLLLALRDDPTTPIDSVPGAARRVRLLQAHHRTHSTTTSVAA